MLTRQAVEDKLNRNNAKSIKSQPVYQAGIQFIEKVFLSIFWVLRTLHW